ncbi:MAG: DUF2335 domain-containing protein [Polaromonas sp.]
MTPPPERIPADAVELIEKVDPLIRALPPEQQQEVRQIVTTAIAFQGPLPPPGMLEHYGRIIPNGPERMMALLEKQTEHRVNMETKLVDGRASVTKTGQWMAFILSLFFGSMAAFLGYTGHEWLAGTIATTTIVGLAVVFVLGKEPGQKSPKSPEPAYKPTKTNSRKKRGG